MSKELVESIVGMDTDKALSVTKDLLESGTDPLDILAACREAMGVVGKRFEEGEFFLPELIMSGDMLKQISEILKPLLKEDSKSDGSAAKVIIATVAGDIHDLGKDIVALLLDVNGFEVIDLGVDVPPEKVVEAIKEHQASVVGLSGFLTLAYESMKQTVEKIKEAGLRDSIKIMIGGGQIDDEIVKFSGADAYGKDAMAAVALAQGWT